MKRVVLPHTRADAEHAAEVTERLREEEPPFGLALTEAICPACRLAFFVTDRVHSWGLCPDCLGAALVRV